MSSRQPLSSSEWRVRMGTTPVAAGGAQYHADLFLNHAFITRIALPSAFENKIAAEVELAVRARKWVSDYETYAHSGATDFGELGSL